MIGHNERLKALEKDNKKIWVYVKVLKKHLKELGNDFKELGNDFTETLSEEICKANAKFILRACNSHDKLVEALKFIASGERTDGSKYDKHDAIGFIGIAKEALAEEEKENDKKHSITDIFNHTK